MNYSHRTVYHCHSDRISPDDTVRMLLYDPVSRAKQLIDKKTLTLRVTTETAHRWTYCPEIRLTFVLLPILPDLTRSGRLQ